MRFGKKDGLKAWKKNNDNNEAPVRYKNKEFDNKIFKVRLAKFLKIAIPGVAALIIIVICAQQWNTRVFATYETIRTVEKPYVSGTTVLAFDGTVLSYSKDGVSCTDKNGKNVWNQTYEMQKPMVVMNGDKVAIGDYNGRTIYVCSTEKILGSISTNLPIRSFTVSQDGLVAAVLEDSEISWINVFKLDGKVPVSCKTQMKNSGYPLQLAFSPNSDLLAVSYLYVQEAKITTRIAFMNFGEVGQNYQDKLVSAYEYQDMIVPSLYFLNNSSSVAVGNNRVMFYQGSQIPESKFEKIQDKEIKKVFQEGEYIGLVYCSEEGQEQYTMEVYDGSGQLVQSIPYNFECKQVLVNDDWIILYNEEQCKIVTTKGKVKLETEFDETVFLVLPTEYKYRYVLYTNQGLETVELK